MASRRRIFLWSTAYSMVAVAALDDALVKAKDCPILAADGSIEVAEAIDM